MTASSEKGVNYGFWLSFFRGAGIVANFDTKYSQIFDENRMKPDMLLDLSKDILKDMGINAMGDIIAILKHAKSFHEESKILALVKSSPEESSKKAEETSDLIVDKIISAPPPSQVLSIKPPPPAASSKKLNYSTTSTATEVVTTTTPSLKVPVKPALKEKGLERTVTLEKKSSAPIGPNSLESKSLKRTIVLTKSSKEQLEEVPFQKKTKVLPEHEGKYIIKMPDGTVTKTKRLFEDRLGPTTAPPEASPEREKRSKNGDKDKNNSTKDKDSNLEKRGIFSRLGQSSSSSSHHHHEKISSSSSSSSDSSPEHNRSHSPNVFNRLGGRDREPESLSLASTSHRPPSEPSSFSYPSSKNKGVLSRTIEPITSSTLTTTSVIRREINFEREREFRPQPESSRDSRSSLFNHNNRVERVNIYNNPLPLDFHHHSNFEESRTHNKPSSYSPNKRYPYNNNSSNSYNNRSSEHGSGRGDLRNQLSSPSSRRVNNTNSPTSSSSRGVRTISSSVLRGNDARGTEHGQVLKTERFRRKDGVSVVKRFIVKKGGSRSNSSNSKRGTSSSNNGRNSRRSEDYSLPRLPEIADPLASYFDDD